MYKYFLLVISILGCSTIPKYHTDSCIDYAIRNVNSKLEPSDFNELLIEYKIIQIHNDKYIVYIVDLHSQKVIKEKFELNIKDVDNNTNISECVGFN